MSYQATNRIETNPFQTQQHNQNIEEESENDEDTSHNIKFTIPQNENNEKGKRNFKFASSTQGRISLFISSSR